MSTTHAYTYGMRSTTSRIYRVVLGILIAFSFDLNSFTGILNTLPRRHSWNIFFRNEEIWGQRKKNCVCSSIFFFEHIFNCISMHAQTIDLTYTDIRYYYYARQKNDLSFAWIPIWCHSSILLSRWCHINYMTRCAPEPGRRCRSFIVLSKTEKPRLAIARLYSK